MLVNLGNPVTNSRQWTAMLSPNAAGTGWNYIAGSFNFGTLNPIQWSVLRNFTTAPILNTYETTTPHYPNSLVGLNTNRGQMRAANGRIFSPLYGNYIAYYDPATETVTQLPQIPGTPSSGSNIPYSTVFGAADGLLYLGTQSSHFTPPILAVLDPTTLALTVLASSVGEDFLVTTTYAYYLAPDTITANKYVYVVTGESPWQLWAVNITPGPNYGVKTKLAEIPSTGTITFQNIAGQGWVANIRNPGLVQYWCGEGALTPYVVGNPPPFAARNVTPASNPLVAPPEVVTTLGAGLMKWRQNPTDPYTSISFDVAYKTPIPIESLCAGNSGIVGNAEQYNGFFDPEWHGVFGGISEGPRLHVGSVDYFAGYPNGVLCEYNPDLPWDGTTNPKQLGYYSPNGNQYAGIKYAKRIAWDGNAGTAGRLYCAGTRERTGTGSGIGYWDKGIADASGQPFAGTFASPLDVVTPAGLVAMDQIGRVAFATKSLDGVSAAHLYIFDRGLALVATQAPIAVADMGRIFPTGDPNIICGAYIDGTGHLSLYRWNVTTGAMVQTQATAFAGTLLSSTIRQDDNSAWVIVDNALIRIDPDTLTATNEQDLTSIAPASVLAFYGDDVYVASGSTLYSASIPLSDYTMSIDPVELEIVSSAVAFSIGTAFAISIAPVAVNVHASPVTLSVGGASTISIDSGTISIVASDIAMKISFPYTPFNGGTIFP